MIGMRVSEGLCNLYGNVHGGALCTILDTATTLAILKQDKDERYFIITKKDIFTYINLKQKIHYIPLICPNFP